MTKPICTAQNPAAPATRQTWAGTTVQCWNWQYDHPDATSECIDDIHEDYEYHCPHCKQRYIAEGADY